LMTIGALLFIVGILFHLMKWPDLFKGIYIGPLIILAGILVCFFSKNSNIKKSR
jgi:hypothetical protein